MRDWVTDIAREVEASTDRSTAALRRIRKRYSREMKPLDRSVVLGAAAALMDTPTPNWLAFELVHFHGESLAGLDEGELHSFASSLGSWGEVDAFACYLSGPAWREGQVSDQWIEERARSEDRYLRRMALVSTVPLNAKARGGRVDAVRTLRVCDLLRADRDDLVKALSWALRELAARDADAVERYLLENEGLLAARVRREVRNKLVTGLKNPRA